MATTTATVLPTNFPTTFPATHGDAWWPMEWPLFCLRVRDIVVSFRPGEIIFGFGQRDIVVGFRPGGIISSFGSRDIVVGCGHGDTIIEHHGLPTKSLIQCTSMCKPWRSMIMNQSFIQYHLRRTINFNKRNDIHLLLVHSVSVRTHSHTKVMSDIRQEVFSVHYDNQDFDKNSEIEFPSALKEELQNDILHVVDDMHCYGNSLIIWNPFIRKSVTLPNPGITFPMYNNSIPNYGGFAAAIGFNFDAMTADYKVVRVATPSNELRGPTMAEVYSLATGLWRSLGDRKSIALFVMDDTSKDYLDIWVMKEKNGEVLVMLLDGGMYLNCGTAITKGVFVSLDLVSKQLKNLEVCGPYCSVDSYEESLLLLDKTDAVSH
ncbi:unnamed protein product [Malus baccata var. baccata]